jgi:hypothetical protein
MFVQNRFVLMANFLSSAAALDDLLRRPRKSNEYIAFFFCEHDFITALDAVTILASLCRQCLSVETLSRSVEHRIKQLLDRTYPDAADLEGVLSSAVTQSSSVTIVLDGLNECPLAESIMILNTLCRVIASSRSPIKLFLSIRDGFIPDLRRVFDTWHQVTMRCAEAQADITAYVEGVVEDKMESKDLIIGDIKLVQDVKDALIRGANGM